MGESRCFITCCTSTLFICWRSSLRRRRGSPRYGWSRKEGRLRVRLLYVHAAVFTGWLLFFLLQSVLVRTGNVAWHRATGWFGAALGAGIPVLGTAIAITMARFNTSRLHQSDMEAALIIPLWDMLA